MVYIFLADGFEEIEAITVIDVLRRAGIELKTVSIQNEMVTGAHHIPVKADCFIDSIKAENMDMLILPGGMPGTTNLEQNEKVQELLKYAVDHNKWIAAICAAPMILGNKGYLKNVQSICYPGFEKYLKGAVIQDNRVNVSGKFITSKGPGTAAEFAFAIVSILKGEELANKLQQTMQYCN
ncbi:MAG: protein deglycase [Clostridiales bacterium]|jgi:4-methyl-5(b-hydroxyethyl)-thiazole monophosphate biosynthesis|nr:protein deglycase [Clostridiales bacterium]MDK2933457.1 protein deglycase [Clostridiales bacterium]